jgi:hypothetical protein
MLVRTVSGTVDAVAAGSRRIGIARRATGCGGFYRCPIPLFFVENDIAMLVYIYLGAFYNRY